MVAGLA